MKTKMMKKFQMMTMHSMWRREKERKKTRLIFGEEIIMKDVEEKDGGSAVQKKNS